VPAALQPTLHQVRNMSQNLSGANSGYADSYAAFMAIMNQGIHSLDPQQEAVGWPMPWHAFSHLVNDDLIAIYTYITNVPRRTGTNDKETSFNTEWCASDSDCTWFPNEHCNVATSECVGADCVANSDCTACQTCTAKKCAAPAASSTCLTQGL
jgi:hypothetical protein